MKLSLPSLQIKREAEKSGLKLVDENRIPDIDIVFDGADQIDSKFCMIKGGGGALLKEKILISAPRRWLFWQTQTNLSKHSADQFR